MNGRLTPRGCQRRHEGRCRRRRLHRVGTIHNSDWRDGFLFVGNQLALDFLNTCPVQDGEPTELLADFGALLRWFQAAEVLSPGQVAGLSQQWGGSARARRTVEAMRGLREKLRKEVLAWEHSSASHGHRRTEPADGRASHAYQAEDDRERLFNGAMVRPAPTRRFVCPTGAQRSDVVRQCGPQPSSQVWTVRAALL